MLRPPSSIFLLQNIAANRSFQMKISRFLPSDRCGPLYASRTCQSSANLWSQHSKWFCSHKDKKKLSATDTTFDAMTTKNTTTESKLLSAEKQSSDKAEDKPSNIKEIKELKIGTTKGLLGVTITIEDSKIEDIIFEKIKTVPMVPKQKDAQTKTKEKAKVEADATAKPKGEPSSKNNFSDEGRKAGEASTLMSLTSVVKPAEAGVRMAAKEASVPNEAHRGTQEKDNECKSPPALIEKTETAAEAAKMQVASAAAAVKELISSATAAVVSARKEEAAEAEAKSKPTRQILDHNRSSLERNFITPARAMSDFLLKPADLENLSKIKRRSPYEQEPPITVFWRKDVEAKAIEIWGSRENLIKAILKREIEQKERQQNLFTVKRRLRDYRREIGYRTTLYAETKGLRGKSGKVVLTAIGINSANFLCKSFAWLFTGSHSMFGEAIHSLADTINQLILAYGLHKSTQIADSDHPYGYSNMLFVTSLISGVGIFCVGTGLSLYHGIIGLINPEPMQDCFWGFCVLGGSLVTEGATLSVALDEIRCSAKLNGVSFRDYVISGRDPCVNVVLTEDTAAVASVFVAGSCMGLSSWTGSPIFDAVGSLLIAGILGGVASFIIYTNAAALVGRSINEDLLNKINSELESDVMIRAIHDVKGIDMGNSLMRYKAEMDFDGRELTRSYLDKQDLNELLKVVTSFQNIEELEQFLLTHGENIVDLMGGEIDRIEMKLRKKFPEIRHCDLEIL